MPLLGTAVLGVWNEIVPEAEDSYNDWYVREHIPERVSVPGMRRGRRYRAFHGSPRYMALYEAESLDVLTTGHYRWQLDHPTPWTSFIMARFIGQQRGICDIIASAGDGIGGVATVIHFSGEDRFRTFLERQVAALPGLTQVLAAHAFRGSDTEPKSRTTEMARRPGPDREVEWVLMIEASDPVWLDQARDAVIKADPRAHGATDIRLFPNYRLLFTMNGTGG